MTFYIYFQTVQKRGAAVIAARKLSSAMSAAKAACDHMRDWFNGTPEVKINQYLNKKNKHFIKLVKMKSLETWKKKNIC